MHRLKEAKRAEWKCSHSGQAPTEEQLMATITPGELKRLCRRRTRGVEEIRSMNSGLLESVWELTDTTGLHLVNHKSMRHVWEVQQKHLECLQDPAGVALYTKVGTLQKGGKSWTSLGVEGDPPPWRVFTDTSVLSFQVHSHLYCVFF